MLYTRGDKIIVELDFDEALDLAMCLPASDGFHKDLVAAVAAAEAKLSFEERLLAAARRHDYVKLYDGRTGTVREFRPHAEHVAIRVGTRHYRVKVSDIAEIL